MLVALPDGQLALHAKLRMIGDITNEGVSAGGQGGIEIQQRILAGGRGYSCERISCAIFQHPGMQLRSLV